MRIILASKSKYRRKALDLLGLKYEVIPSEFDEKSIREKDPMQLAEKLARAKAQEVGKTNPNSLIISGDLFVVHMNKIIEKPADEKEAYEMLRSFSGQSFEVVASVAVFNTKSDKISSASEKFTIKFRELTDFEIKDYISRNPVTSFAGGFDSEGALRFAESSSGKFPFFNSLPMGSLIKLLREKGLEV